MGCCIEIKSSFDFFSVRKYDVETKIFLVEYFYLEQQIRL